MLCTIVIELNQPQTIWLLFYFMKSIFLAMLSQILKSWKREIWNSILKTLSIRLLVTIHRTVTLGTNIKCIDVYKILCLFLGKVSLSNLELSNGFRELSCSRRISNGKWNSPKLIFFQESRVSQEKLSLRFSHMIIILILIQATQASHWLIFSQPVVLRLLVLSYGNENDNGYDKHLRSRTEHTIIM